MGNLKSQPMLKLRPAGEIPNNIKIIIFKILNLKN